MRILDDQALPGSGDDQEMIQAGASYTFNNFAPVLSTKRDDKWCQHRAEYGPGSDRQGSSATTPSAPI